jgi:glycosyltransferase involved in cell wall biosynthesis
VANPRVLFCSYHGLLDPASGAALATFDLLRLLAARGWVCGAVCGPHRDDPDPGSAADHLCRQGYTFESRTAQSGALSFAVHHVSAAGLPVTVFDPAVRRSAEPSVDEEAAFVPLVEQVCEKFRPDLLLTYGGHRLARRVMNEARRRGIKVVFALHNFEYRGADLFRLVDAVFVPTEFARRTYQQELGIDSTPLPGPFDWDRIVCDQIERRFLTYVNPRPEKGVYWVARLIEVLARLRPDIPVLVVEGRAGVDWLGRCGVDLVGVSTVSRMKNTPDPRSFYSVSRLVLVPSLWRESFGRVAAEAMMNEIPVIASTRGSLPEVLAGAGVLLDIPSPHTPEYRVPPSAKEVSPWASVVARLWDDESAYTSERERCRTAALAWRPEQLLPRFEQYFHDVIAGRAVPPVHKS